jgi:hypothetical protein
MFRDVRSRGDSAFEQHVFPRAARGVAAIHRKCGVYTRPLIVAKILDEVGWTTNADLSQATLLEPAVGDGAFLTEAAGRLVDSMRLAQHPLTIRTLGDRISSFEIHPREANRARENLAQVLKKRRLPAALRRGLVERWITTGDFLLTSLADRFFSHVVGNPPYVRWSKIPVALRRRYERQLPKRMTKGDLFLPFLDLCIGYLVPGGRLGFICSNRWRFMAFAEEFRNKRLPEIEVEYEQTLEADEAYRREVDVYPSLVVMRRRARATRSGDKRKATKTRTLREAGYVVRVGPALGCTSAYVLGPEEDDVEPELLVPWFDGGEIEEGKILWRGRRVMALHDADGRLRVLRDYPGAAKRLRRHHERLKERATVKAGTVWYSPIDRVMTNIWARPKLVIPELAKVPRLAIDRSGSIPSHGVYAIFAPHDDLTSLHDLLKDGGLSRALEKIAPRVKGGYIRCYRKFLDRISLGQ